MLLFVGDGDLAFVQEDLSRLRLRYVTSEMPVEQTGATQDELLTLAERIGTLRFAMRG
jgi:hypothetical protein